MPDALFPSAPQLAQLLAELNSMPDLFPVRTPSSASVSGTPCPESVSPSPAITPGCRAACAAAGAPLPRRVSVLSLSEEENRAAGLLGGAGHAAHQPHPQRAAAREVRPGELHRLGRQVRGRVLQFQEEEDN